MKKLRRTLLGTWLALSVAAVIALSAGHSCGPAELSEAEMAALSGLVKKCAYCIDMCGDQGTADKCTSGTCSAGNANDCHKLYRSSSTPTVSIWICSTLKKAGEIDCSDRGDAKTCSTAKVCECYYEGIGDRWYCNVNNLGTWSKKDECSTST